MRRPTYLALLSLILLLASVGPAAAQVTVFEGTFSRLAGEPTTTHRTFTAIAGSAKVTLHNGGVAHAAHRLVSDATIRVNGNIVFDEMQFNQRVTRLETMVDLRDGNDLEVFLEGKPGGTVAIRVELFAPDGIQQVWARLAKLYETGRPSEEDLTAWFEGNVAPDYVRSGIHYEEELAAWLAGTGGPPVGVTFSFVVTKSLDVSGTPYTKGYEIRLVYKAGGATGSMLTYMVFDGSRWLWFGNQEWVDYDLRPIMGMTVGFYGNISFDTPGLGITLWDGDECSAYRHGVRSGIVSGPGLPPEGTKLVHMYPLPYLRLYPKDPANPGGNFLVKFDDATIQAIPEPAEYTIRLYSQSAETVSLADTPLASFVKTIPKRPLLSTDLNASLFPALVAPATHKSSEVNLGGLVEVQWTNPPSAPVNYLFIGLTIDGTSFYSVDTNPAPGATSATLDTAAYPRPPWRSNGFYLQAADDYGRLFGLHWSIYPWW